MAQYIDKSALVAEIEKQLNKWMLNSTVEGYYKCKLCHELLSFIDSLQEEPVSEVWHDASEEPKPNMELICVGKYCNPLVLSSNSDSFKSLYISKWAYFNDLLNLSNVQRTVKNWKEPVSEDLDKAADKYAHEAYSNPVDRNVGKADFIAGAKWEDNIMINKACEWLDSANFYYYLREGVLSKDLINDFRKAIEERKE